MIENAVTVLTKSLNDHLKLRFSSETDLVVASSIDRCATDATNKIVLTLADIATDVSLKNRSVAFKTELPRADAPLHISMRLLVSANFDVYHDALKFISSVVAFFHSSPSFNPVNTPAMHPKLDFIEVVPENVSTQELNNIWNMHGGSYLPCVVYRVRLQYNT